jgi:hypothetical protein
LYNNEIISIIDEKDKIFLKPTQKIISAKIDTRVINLVENNVLTRENFRKLFAGLDETTLTTILNDYQKKWGLLIQYLEIDEGNTTFEKLLDRLINILYDFYYLRLLNPAILLDSGQHTEDITESSIDLDMHKNTTFLYNDD